MLETADKTRLMFRLQVSNPPLNGEEIAAAFCGGGQESDFKECFVVQVVCISPEIVPKALKLWENVTNRRRGLADRGVATFSR